MLAPRFSLPALCLGLLSTSPVGAAQMPEFLEQYCLSCHNFEDWAGSLSMEGMDFEHVSMDAATWEKVLRKLQAGMMPPVGEPRPMEPETEAFVGVLARRLDAAAPSLPPSPALHRLNRAEYANAIRDLLDLEVDPAMLLPLDDASEGFDNMAISLGNSPALMQAYVAAAMKISRWALGDMSTTESTTVFNASPGLVQDSHLEGLPLGTRGGMRVTYRFPLDARYHFSISGGLGRRGNGDTAVDITLDGEQVTVEDPRDFSLMVSAGQHELTAAIVDLRRPAGVNDIYAQYEVRQAIGSIKISGPFEASGKGDTASRRRVFSCYPANNDQNQSCARQIVETLASRAFRRPVAATELQSVMTFYNQGFREGGFEGGIQSALARLLVDPRFLFRMEAEPEGIEPGESFPISDLELASRLSFFLWSSIPDQELLDLATHGRLSEDTVLRQQVLRMLSDPRAAALVDNFAGQWLFLRKLEGLTPEAESFDENLRQAFLQETRLLVQNIISQDRPVTELLNANYTFLNERLARHYGIEGVRGSHFRRVSLPENSPRRGLLGHGSILTLTSTASRTSPVLRGSWILENLLHAPVPAPPPGVETNLDGDGNSAITSSVRERLEAHRADPACASCHDILDPLGFALENFDSIGAWREYDGDTPVDPSGVLVDGSEVHGPADLRRALMRRAPVFVGTMTEKLLTYALGRGLEYADMPTVRAILRQAQAEDYRFSALVLGIVASEQFKMRVKPTDAPLSAETTALMIKRR